nr:MAG TPA: chromosome anchoring protein [Caudoviricetes sp.]
MGWEHEPGTVWRAQELYCMDRLSFERVSELTGVATSTLKRWADKYRWRERREELAQVESEIRFNTVMGRKAILQRLLEAEDGKEASQVAFAVASLESLALKQAELAAAGKIPSFFEPEARPHIATQADAVAALREAVRNKVGMALSDPGKINAATVQDVKRCLELLGELEARLPKEKEESRDKALSPENAQAIREILGTS